MLDLFAFLALVAELEAPGGVAADLSAGYLAVAEGFGDNHVLVDAPVCKQSWTQSQSGEFLILSLRWKKKSKKQNIPSLEFALVSKSIMGSMDPKKFLPKFGIGGNKFRKLNKGSWNRDLMLLLQRE